MGQALYRKYRPRSLEQVIGQSHITDTLKNALKTGAIRHAYLFTGLKGSGKTSVARILAHEINNIPYDDDSMHLDIIEIDAASNRRIDEIRELRDKVHIAPTSSKYKVYIIDEVHMLTREAFNALLKTLEEPPEHAVFILATTEAHKVPATIISRTQRFNFKPFAQDSAVEHLRSIAKNEKLTITDGALKLLAEHGKGSFRDSISMLDQIAGFGHKSITSEVIEDLLGIPDSSLITTVLTAVADNNSTALFDSLQQLREKGADSATSAKIMIETLRKNLMDKSSHIESKKSVQLMESLLPLTGINSSFEGLEIILLNAIDFETTKPTANDKPPVKQKLSAKVEEEIITENKASLLNEPTTKEEKTAQTSKTHKSSDDAWGSVMKALKLKNNTIYGILRMADIEINDSVILLKFQFEFHKKQITQQKNIALLNGLIHDSFGKNINVDIVIEKPAKKTLKPKIVLENEAVTSVSNIFDGAELLES